MPGRKRGNLWATVQAIFSIAWPIAVLVLVPIWIRPVLPNVRDTIERAAGLCALAILPYILGAAVGDWAFGERGVVRNARTLLLTWIAFVLLTIALAVLNYAFIPRKG